MDFPHHVRSGLLAGVTLVAALGGAGCSEPPATPQLKGQVHLTLIHTSDLHSRLFPYNLQLGQVDSGLGLGASGTVVNVGGAARVSHVVGRERARADRVLHLSGGDCFQGAPIFNFFSGEAEIRAESAIGTDAMIVANHEFDRGSLNLGLQLQKWADFPVLAANYQFDSPATPGASPLGGLVQPYTVFDMQGLKVAVIGMGNLSSMTSLFDTPNKLGITPLNTTEVTQFYVDFLRPMVDVIVMVTHLGVNVDKDMIATTSGIDVVLGGHNHIVLQPPQRVQDCSKYSEPVGGCDVDSECADGNWCTASKHSCAVKVPNGGALPSDSAHKGTALAGACTAGAARIACQSGVCDPSDDKCGYAVGNGPCGSASECRSGACDKTTGLCEAAAACTADTDCPSGWCNLGSQTCAPKLANGEAIPNDPTHANPALDGTCTKAAAALACQSGVCDPKDDKCGFAEGGESCKGLSQGTVCRSGVCGDDGKCAADPGNKVRHFIALDGNQDPNPETGFRCNRDSDCASNFCLGTQDQRIQGLGQCKTKRYCEPRDVVLAHSGAFAKYVGRLDLIVSNDPADLADRHYDKVDGFEVLTHDYQLFPITEGTPEDPLVSQLLEPYHQGLDTLANLDLLAGYALDGSKRNSTSGGDSALGNLISTAMWLRLGIQTDFSLTNSTGIRTDLVPGPVTIEEMFNIFPFDNSITKMQLSGVEVQELFDFVARRSTGRGCVSQVQIAGARVVMNCGITAPAEPGQPPTPGVATNVYIGTAVDSKGKPIKCTSDDDCLGPKCKKDADCGAYNSCNLGTSRCRLPNACDIEAGVCWQPIEPIASYELATSNYLAGGGSGFRVLQRNTTQNDTKIQQRDALVDYIRAGHPCGADDAGKLKSCSKDGDCASIGAHYVCACPEATVEGEVCTSDATKSCGGQGQCVLDQCRTDVAGFQRKTCDAAPNQAVKNSCLNALLPCAAAGEQCKYLACVDRRLGNFSDGRVKMVGQ